MPQKRRKDLRTDAIEFAVSVNFEEVVKEEQPPQTFVHAFDSKGRFLASASVEKGKATLSLPPESIGQTVRFLVSPRLEKQEAPNLIHLSHVGAYEKRLRVDPKNPRVEITIVKPIWKLWLFCSCVVRGRVIKRFTLPDGTIKEMPICNTRVTICDVDTIPKIIRRLPDNLIFRLRDDLIPMVIRQPIPLPPPPPPPPPEAILGSVSPLLKISSAAEMPIASGQTERRTEVLAQPFRLQLSDLETQKRLQAAATTQSSEELRKEFVNLADIIALFICNWPWFDDFFWYTANCFRTVMVDENGRFETTIWYPCFGDKPNLYFKAEQLHGAVWEAIYKPPIRCNTYWDYECGTEVVINVTDPSAIPTAPEDPVDPPVGVSTWVMPYAVGGTKIWGTPPPVLLPPPLPPLILPAPAGWVKTDGKTDYGGIVDAPFGSYIGLRLGSSNNIPNAAIKYYRWSYRKVGGSDWKPLTAPVFKHYVKQSPGILPTFPAYKLGPNTVGLNACLFEFKPPSPPPPDPGDPTGTITYWPIDDFFDDIYSGFLDTTKLPPDVAEAAGQYQFKLEVFDASGIQAMPSTGFKFIVPRGVASDGLTILAREAQSLEIDAGAFIFNLWIDNNPTTASIDAPYIGATVVADECGFLRYDPTSTTLVSIGFHAIHPNMFATFSFQIVRGAVFLPGASTVGEVAATSLGPYAGDGTGNFSNDFARTILICGPVDPTKCCANAAFAETLHVWGKATNGWARIGYDAFASRAFALAAQT